MSSSPTSQTLFMMTGNPHYLPPCNLLKIMLRETKNPSATGAPLPKVLDWAKRPCVEITLKSMQKEMEKKLGV